LLVFIPLIGGIACFAGFLLWESRAKHPMLELSLFRIRNFWVANLTTLTAYAGLIGGLFFVGLFLQQTAGYTPLEAGLATTPMSVIMFVLSPGFGRFASGTGPRLPMTAGPITSGIGMFLFLRIGVDADYVTEVLPAVLVFGLGLAAMVAPLTATVLDSVEERHVGIASGINNGVSRVAGLLAIAVLGAVISGSFASHVDENLSSELSAQGQSAVEEAKAKPLGAPKTGGLEPQEASEVSDAVGGASESAFHLAMTLTGSLMIAGGLAAAVGIQNPRRGRERAAPRAAMAGDCGHDCDEPVAEREAEAVAG
jgi:hypothetical protein